MPNSLALNYKYLKIFPFFCGGCSCSGAVQSDVPTKARTMSPAHNLEMKTNQYAVG